MLDGKSIALLSGEQIDDCIVEITEIIKAMKGVNARVRVVSSRGKHYLRKKENAVWVDLSIDEARSENFDAIILCSSCRSSDAHAYIECMEFIRDNYAQGKLIAAIGNGTEVIRMVNLVDSDDIWDSSAVNEKFLVGREDAAHRPILRQANLILAHEPLMLMSFVNEIIRALYDTTTDSEAIRLANEP